MLYLFPLVIDLARLNMIDSFVKKKPLYKRLLTLIRLISV